MEEKIRKLITLSGISARTDYNWQEEGEEDDDDLFSLSLLLLLLLLYILFFETLSFI